MKILCGPIGTELIKRVGHRKVLDDYNLLEARLLETIYRDYLEAGAEILVTNTFNSHCLSLAESEYSAKELNQKAIETLSKLNGDFEIAGSVGGSRVSVSSAPQRKGGLIDSYRQQLAYLGSCKYILHETIYDFENADCFKVAFEERRSEQELLLSTCLTDLPKLEKLFRHMEALRPTAIGLNCVKHDQNAISALKFLSENFETPLIYYPNNMTSCTSLEELKGLNLAFIGGCCGSEIESYRNITLFLPAQKPIT